MTHPFRIFEAGSVPWLPHPVVPTLLIKTFENKVSGTGYDVIMALVPPGGRIDWHTHPVSSETILIVQGQGVIFGSTREAEDTQAEAVPLATGTVLTIPIGLRHAVNNTGTVDLHIFAIHAPATI